MSEKILIALVDQNLINTLSDKLKAQNFQVDTINNGTGVIDKMKAFMPDLVLFDVNFKDKNGYDILVEKSLDKDVTKIPVIVVSNSGDPVLMNQLPSTPSIKDYVIRTHIEPEELLLKIEKAFGRTPTPSSSTAPAAAAPTGKKVLWVEDDKLLSSILSKKFQSTGHVLLKANNGKEAFAFLETEVPDIMVFDIMLPEMTGFDILQKIKMQEKFRKIPVIMLSNLSKQGDIDKAKLLGANKFIVKAAVSLDEIIREVESLTK